MTLPQVRIQGELLALGYEVHAALEAMERIGSVDPALVAIEARHLVGLTSSRTEPTAPLHRLAGAALRGTPRWSSKECKRSMVHPPTVSRCASTRSHQKAR